MASDDKGAAFVGGKKYEKKFVREFNGKCHKCKKTGHMKKDCPWNKSERKANSVVRNSNAVAFMGRTDELKISNGGKMLFCVDSGCSDHLVNDASHLKSTRRLREPFVVEVAKEGVSLSGQSVGELTGFSNKNVEFRMKNVIFIPELRENLLSVKKLSQAGIDVLFTGKGGLERAEFKHNGEVIGVAYLRGNLYQLELEVENIGQANICKAKESLLWHRRLGHASQQALEGIAKHEMATGFTRKVDRIGFCDTCVMSKQCREPFDGVRERATRPLERIHSDVCGPIDPTAWDGSRFFVSFIDDWTHFAMIYPIKRKSEVFDCFKQYEAVVTNQCQSKICKLTVDQGREYFSNEQKKYY